MKLGLLAMSGVRVYNQALTKLGLTLPGFIERGKVIASLPSLALLTLAGLTPEDVEITYVEVPNPVDTSDLPGDFDAVAISSYSARVLDAYALADRYRARGTPVILGGLHVTALPAEAASHADSIVLGEAEPVWGRVVDDLRSGALQPVYDARNRPFDLANAPMPRFELLDISRYNRLTVQTQRGCPFDCEFCAASIRLVGGYKVKPVSKVVAEIRHIKELWRRPFIELADDNTFANKRHARALVRALAAEGVRWFTETDVSVADDDELLELLSDSGCAQLLIGLESPSATTLNGVERRSNWKAKRAHRYRSAIDKIQSRGITVNGCFVMGLDGASRESFDEVLRFARESGLYEIQLTVLTPFPGTPLYQRLAASGRLLHAEDWNRCTLFDVNFVPDSMTARELEEQFHRLVGELYSEGATTGRRRRFRQQMRRTRRGRFRPAAGDARIPTRMRA